MSKAVDQMIVHQTDRLHEGIADRRTDETEAAPAKLMAEGFRLARPGGNLAEAPPAILDRFAAGEGPEEAIEAARVAPHDQECLGVGDRRFDLEPIADDAG